MVQNAIWQKSLKTILPAYKVNIFSNRVYFFKESYDSNLEVKLNHAEELEFYLYL